MRTGGIRDRSRVGLEETGSRGWDSSGGELMVGTHLAIDYCTRGDLVDRTLKESELHNDERAFDEPIAALYVALWIGWCGRCPLLMWG